MFGNPDLEILYKAAWTDAAKALRNNSCPMNDIKDVYQNAFLITALAMNEGRVNGTPSVYLVGVCLKIWRRLRDRRRKREGDLEGTDYKLTPSNERNSLDTEICKEMREKFHEIMERELTPQQYMIMVLMRMKGFKNDEIAEELGITTPVVGNVVSESNRRLEKFIEKNPYWRDYLKTYKNDCFNR